MRPLAAPLAIAVLLTGPAAHAMDECAEPPAPPRGSPALALDPDFNYSSLDNCLRHRAYAYRHLQQEPLTNLAEVTASQCRSAAVAYWDALGARRSPEQFEVMRTRLEADLSRAAVDRNLEYRACASRRTAEDWANRYQTLLAGLVGFGGIMLTLWGNAALARRQARDAAERDAEGLRSALIGDLAVAADSLRNARKTIEEAKGDGTGDMLVPVITATTIYEASLPMMGAGVLPPEQISTVVRTYGLLRELPHRINLLAGRATASPESGYIRVGAAQFGPLGQLYDMALREVEAASGELKPAHSRGVRKWGTQRGTQATRRDA